MKYYDYLIIGGGMAASAAVAGIRSADPLGSIAIIGDEFHRPYNRPPLSKGLWHGKPLDKIWREVPAQEVDLLLGRRVTAIEPDENQVVDSERDRYTYKKLLLATGGTPRRLPFGGQSVLYFRTLDDYRLLRQQAAERKRFAVIGGGFIGSELAAALRTNGQDVVMIFPEHGIGATLFPADLSEFLVGYYEQQGVQVLAGRMVTDIIPHGKTVTIGLDAGGEVVVDHVVAGIGLRPNTQLAQLAGLAVEDGILVNECLETSRAGIFAAGDVAAYYNPALDRRMRTEHEDNANRMGFAAGQNMAGLEAPYHYLPFFYSDLFDLGYEAVGELDPSLEVTADWEDPYRKGVLYYHRGEQVRGVLLWNTWGMVDAARALIGKTGVIGKAGALAEAVAAG